MRPERLFSWKRKEKGPSTVIVLIGNTGNGKSATGNTILGKQAFISEVSPFPLTKKIELAEGHVAGRHFTVLDTPDLLQIPNALCEIKQKIAELSLSGPQVYLLVIRLGCFTETERKTAEKMQEVLGTEALENAIVLFTFGDRLEGKTVEELIESNVELQKLLEQCGKRFNIFNNLNMYDDKQVKKLIISIEKMQIAKDVTVHTIQSNVKSLPSQMSQLNENDQNVNTDTRGLKITATDSDLNPTYSSQDSTIRIVLIGNAGTGKSASGNTILGRKEFLSEVSPCPVTQVCQSAVGNVAGKHVTVVDTPDLLDTDLSVNEVRKSCGEIFSCEVHVYLLVIQLGRFTEEERNAVERIQDIFGVQALKKILVLFSFGDRLKGKKVEEFLQISKDLQRLIKQCGKWYHVFNNLDSYDKQVKELFVKLDKMLTPNEMGTGKQNTTLQLSCQQELNEENQAEGDKMLNKRLSEQAFTETTQPSTIQIVLIGHAGNGKSASGNVIMGREVFFSEVNPCSVTQDLQQVEGNVSGRHIIVVDTPDLLHLERSFTKIKQNCTTLSAPGCRAYLLVIQLDCFTQEERKAAEKIQEIFGADALDNTIVLFTFGDRLKDKTIEEFLKTNKGLLQLVKKCGNRYHVFNNLNMHDHTQVEHLMSKIEKCLFVKADMYTKDPKPSTVPILSMQPELCKKQEEKVEEGSENKITADDSEANFTHFHQEPAIRIVLIGNTGTGKSASGNTILGRKEFLSEVSPCSVTQVCQSAVGNVAGKHVAVVDTPDLLDTDLSVNEVKKRYGELFFSEDHVYLLVIQLGRFTEEERNTFERIQDIFGVEALKKIMVLFSFGDRLKGKKVEEFLQTNKDLQWLIKQCGERYHVFNNLDNNDKQVKELFVKLDKMLTVNEMGTGKQNTALQLSCQLELNQENQAEGDNMLSKRLSEQTFPVTTQPSTIQILLIGRAGTGKSASGNLIMGRKVFLPEVNPCSVMQDLQQVEGNVSGRHIIVVDTPDLLHLERSFTKIKQKCTALSAPGCRAYLLVIQLDCFTQEEMKAAEKIQEIFGADALDNTIVLFTFGDRLKDKTIEEFLKTNKGLLQLVKKCGNRYHVFNNLDVHDHTQVEHLMSKIEKYLSVNMCIKESKPATVPVLSQKPELYEKQEEQVEETKIIADDSEARLTLYHQEPAVRIVLIGNTGTGKSASGNTILGRKEFLSEVSPCPVTQVCQSAVGNVAGKHVAVVDTPDLLDTDLSVNEVKKRYGELFSCKAHVYLLVIQLGRFTEEERNATERIQDIFGVQALKKILVLFSFGDRLKGKKVEEFLETNKDLQWLIKQCGERYHVFNNLQNHDDKQVLELFMKIDKTLTMNKQVAGKQKTDLQISQLGLNEDYQEEEEIFIKRLPADTFLVSPLQPSAIHIVLIGSTGTGKSASGNTIMGRKVFLSEISSCPVTQKFQKAEGNVAGRHTIVVDTPDLLDSEGPLTESIGFLIPEPCVYLLVMKLGRFTQNDMKAAEKVQDIFGTDSLKNTIVLFTFGDRLNGKRVEDVLGRNTNLRLLVEKCGNRYHVFNNLIAHDNAQVKDLLQKIEYMLVVKNGEHKSDLIISPVQETNDISKNVGKKQGSKDVTNRQQQPILVGGRYKFSSKVPAIQIVLIGNIGNGKSASGNTILGKDVFLSEVSSSSVTQKCQRKAGNVAGRHVIVIDTPALLDSKYSFTEVKCMCEELPYPSINLYLLVIQLGHITEAEKRAPITIQKIFGGQALKTTMVLFTFGDKLKGKSIENFLKENKDVHKIVKDCGGSYHVFDNLNQYHQTQVPELLKKIQNMEASDQQTPIPSDIVTVRPRVNNMFQLWWESLWH